MEVKYPIEYELEPERIEKGNHWITVKLRNIGKDDFRYVRVQLNSVDSSSILVDGMTKGFEELKPNETEEVPFQVTADKSGDIYLSMVAHTSPTGPESFMWESPPIPVVVGDEKAELKGVFILAHPRVSVGQTVEIEAIVQGLGNTDGLRLELWAQTPKEASVELTKFDLKDLPAGAEERYSASLKTDEKGYYTVHAYLYDKVGRIDYKSDTIVVV